MRYITRTVSVLTRVTGNVFDTMTSVWAANEEAVTKAVEMLKNGSVIALPTDTIYGIAADAKSDSSIRELYKIKGRDFDKPIALCVGSTADVNLWGKTDNLPENLVESLLPGPVTLLLERTDTISLNLNPGVGKVGIRVPDSDFIRMVASSLGSAIALTSANVSCEPSTVRVEEFKHLWPLLGGVFDAGHLGESRAGSTVVDLTQAGKYTIVRSGSASEQTIKKLKQFGLSNSKM